MPFCYLPLRGFKHFIKMLDFMRCHLSVIAVIPKYNIGNLFLFDLGIVANNIKNKYQTSHTLVVNRKHQSFIKNRTYCLFDDSGPPFVKHCIVSHQTDLYEMICGCKYKENDTNLKESIFFKF